MIETDVFYGRPIVCQMITGNRDLLIQLDQAGDSKLDRAGYIPGTYLKPISFVSNVAPAYP